jgi:hypothetical protein
MHFDTESNAIANLLVRHSILIHLYILSSTNYNEIFLRMHCVIGMHHLSLWSDSVTKICLLKSVGLYERFRNDIPMGVVFEMTN